MRFPDYVDKAELLLYVYASTLGVNATQTDNHTIIPLDAYSTTPAAISWTSQPMPEGCFILVCAKLMFYKTNKFSVRNYVNDAQLSPAMLVTALHS